MFPSSDRSINVLVNFILHCISEWAVVGGVCCFLGPVFPGAGLGGVQCFRPVTDPSMFSLIAYYHCVSEWTVVGGVSVVRDGYGFNIFSMI